MPNTWGPLEGVRILDLTRLQPGNYATLLMADLGADVIKVEEPGRGDYVRWSPPMVGSMSSAHRVLNRNKKSVTLNLKKPQGVDLLLKLVGKTDVLIESFRPGVMDRLGVGYQRLSEVNPGLIYAAITGYGQDGPYRLRAGHDINYIAVGGLLEKTGPKGEAPILPSVQIGDLAGAMMSVIGVLSALAGRSRTGKGDFIDVSMMDAAISWLALHLAPWFAGGSEPERGAAYLNGGYPFYRVYECADGKFLSVGALEPQFWSALCNAIGHEELVSEQMVPPQRREEIHRILEDTFRSKPRNEWVGVLADLDACVAPVNSFEEMEADPQVIARKMVISSEVEGFGPWKELGLAVQLLGNPGTIRMGAPALGEHNSEVYGEFGLGSADLELLATEGVL